MPCSLHVIFTITDCLEALMQVYNITRYLKFHPGGMDWIMKGAGTDSSVLFQKYHAWVNADMLLKECLIGMLAPPAASADAL